MHRLFLGGCLFFFPVGDPLNVLHQHVLIFSTQRDEKENLGRNRRGLWRQSGGTGGERCCSGRSGHGSQSRKRACGVMRMARSNNDSPCMYDLILIIAECTEEFMMDDVQV